MHSLRTEMARLSVRTEWGIRIVCPRCETGAMAIVERDGFEVALMCLACGEERMSERVKPSERRIRSEVGRHQRRAQRIDILQRRLSASHTMMKKEMCQVMGVSRSRLDRMMSKDPIKGGMIVREQPNKWRFPYEAAETWIENKGDVSRRKYESVPVG